MKFNGIRMGASHEKRPGTGAVCECLLGDCHFQISFAAEPTEAGRNSGADKDSHEILGGKRAWLNISYIMPLIILLVLWFLASCCFMIA